MSEKDTLLDFLELPLWTSDLVFDKFRYHQRAIFREHSSDPKQRFVFIQGTRKEKVVLVAHADTFFDECYDFPRNEHDVFEEDGWFTGNGKNGLGADDRAGCAMLYLLKDSGHSILITDGEEQRQLGSRWLMNSNKDIADQINKHQFMIQLDLAGATDFKCYDVGTEKFREFIKATSGYNETGTDSRTDIVSLCRDICGVNFSTGSYGEHTHDERINMQEWENTLTMVKKMLDSKLPKFHFEKMKHT